MQTAVAREARRKGRVAGWRADLSVALLVLAGLGSLLYSCHPAYAQPATCVVSGTVLDISAQPVANTPVRFRVISPTPPYATQDLTTKTAANGTWSLTLVQGLNAQVDIPAIGIAKDTVILTGASCPAAFTDLTLSNRGTLTPATILSTTGPSMGGDLTGSSPNPSVIALRGQPLAVGNCANGQARVYSSGSGSYTCQAVTAGSVVNSITGGTGITVSGTATVPIVGITSAGVTATQLGAGAASSNVGSLSGALSGTLPGPALATGAAATNVGALGGALAGTLPNPTIAPLAIVNADVNAAAAIAWTKINKAGAVPGDIGAENPSNKGAASGYVPLDASTHISTAYLPVAGSPPAVHATTHATGNTDPITPASITAANLVHTHAETDVSGLVGDLGDKLSLTSGGTIAGNTIFNGSATFNGSLIFAGAFAPTGDIRVQRTTDATAPVQQRQSNNFILEGSVWNTISLLPEKRLTAWVNTPTALNAGKLSLIGYAGDNALGSEVSYFDTVTGIFHGGVIGAVTGNVTGDLTGNVTGNASGTAATFTGALVGDVTSTGMTTLVAAVGGQTGADVATATIAANAATASNTPAAILKRDGAGQVAASTFTGALAGNATTASDGLTSASGTLPLTLTLNAKALTGNVADATAGAKGAIQLAGDIGGSAGTPSVVTVGGQAAATVAAGAVLANAATNTNTASAIVKRDGGGDFAAGMVTANLTGNVTGNASGSAASFTGSLAGDVTGTQGATTVAKLQGRTVATAAPANTNVLCWVTANNDWEPCVAAAGAGTVTSVSGSGGTTGLTLTGGPITGIGTLTLGGTLGVPNGGTGATTLTGYMKGNGAGVVTAAAQVPLATDVSGTLPVGSGGTGATTLTGIVHGTGAAALTASAVALATGDVSGTLPVTNGGTGVATLTGIAHGNGAGAFSGGAIALATGDVSGTLPIANGGTNATTQQAALNNIAPGSAAKGDLIAHTGANWVRHPVGVNGYTLTAASNETNGLAWDVAKGISVMSYGADATGASDSSTAIQNAINAAVASSGAMVVFPAGSFKIAATLTVPAGIIFQGAGEFDTTLGCPSNLDCFNLTNTTDLPVAFRDFLIGTSAGPDATVGAFIHGNSSQNFPVFITHCLFQHYFDAVKLNSNWFSVISDSLFGASSSAGSAITIDNLVNEDQGGNIITRNTFLGTSAYTIRQRAGGATHIVGNEFVSAAPSCVYLDIPNGKATSDLFIRGNSFESSGGDMIQLVPAGSWSSVLIQDNEFALAGAHNNILVAPTATGFVNAGLVTGNLISGGATALKFNPGQASGANLWFIASNVFNSHTTAAIQLPATAANTGNVIVGTNQIIQSGTAPYISGEFNASGQRSGLLPGIEMVFAQTASSSTTANSATTMLGTGVGSLTIPPGRLMVGTRVRLRLSGFCGTADGGAATKTIVFKIGGVTVLTATTSSFAYLLNDGWQLEATATIRTTGAGGTGIGIVNLGSHTGGGSQVYAGTGTFAANTPTALAIDVTYNNGNATGSLTTTEATVEILN